MQKITPFLWFDDRAEEAAEFYVSVFNARPGSATDGIEGRERLALRRGRARTRRDRHDRDVQLEGQEFTALNGGPQFSFTEAISFFVNCEAQEEVDELWRALSEGGEEGRAAGSRTGTACRGRSSPTALMELLERPRSRTVAARHAGDARDEKIDIAGLQRAAEAA